VTAIATVTLQEALRHERVRQGKSQRQVERDAAARADELGASYRPYFTAPYISRIESGDRRPGFEAMQGYALGLGLTFVIDATGMRVIDGDGSVVWAGRVDERGTRRS
jgi:transcriptional regulator with XRE-family HTH domain